MGFISQGISQPGFNPYFPDKEVKIKRSPIRLFLNKFSLMTSFGYGRTFYKTEWPGVDILETNSNSILLEDYSMSADSISFTGIDNWFYAPASVTGSVVNDSTSHIYSADSVMPLYKGSAPGIPFSVSLHIDIERFRIGAGYAYEIHKVNKLNPGDGGEMTYTPNFKTSLQKYYVLLGGKVYNWKGWDYYAEIQVGKVKYKNPYDLNNLSSGLYFNLGIPIEYEFSEYFWFYVRPSFEFKNYSLSMPTTYAESNIPDLVTFSQPTLYVNFGFRFKFPEVRRCPVKSCHIQLKHVHSQREFRGQPFYKEQNPKIGQLEHWRHKFDWLKGK